MLWRTVTNFGGKRPIINRRTATNFGCERPRFMMANGHPYIIDCSADFKSDKMSSEDKDNEWSDCEWFDEQANKIILDTERRQLAMEIQVHIFSMISYYHNF